MPEKEKIIEALKSGKIEFTKRVECAIQTMDLNNPGAADFTITNAAVCFWGPNKNNQGGMGIDWSSVSAGCGRVDFYIQDGKLKCDNEAMSKKFIQNLFGFILENCELRT